MKTSDSAFYLHKRFLASLLLELDLEMELRRGESALPLIARMIESRLQVMESETDPQVAALRTLYKKWRDLAIAPNRTDAAEETIERIRNEVNKSVLAFLADPSVQFQMRTIRHEFRQPLQTLTNSINSLRDWLKDRDFELSPADVEQLQGPLDDLKVTESRLVHAVDGLAALGDESEALSETNVGDIWKTIQESNRRTANLSNIVLRHRDFVDLPHLYLLKNSLRMALDNAVRNALVSHQNCADKDGRFVEFAARFDKPWLTLEVRDNAAGIRPEILAAMRAPRAEWIRSNPATGMGLGTVLMHMVVGRHVLDGESGSLEIVSQPGATAITFRIPCRA